MWAQIPMKIYECYMFFNCWHVIVSTWVVFLAATFSNARWASELVQRNQENRQRKRNTLDTLRSLPTSLEIYRCLFMQCSRLNQLGKFWLVGLAIFTGKFVGVYMGFATIKLGIENKLPILEFMAYPTSCVFLGALLAFTSPEAERYHIDSQLYIRQLRRHPRRVIRQSVRALIPMSASVANFFNIEKGYGVETMQDAIVEIGDLVISFG